jgi:uncharacterized protein YdeI (YjbR/CyaY-like superfamily)
MLDNNIETFYPKNQQEWREWLHCNHDVKTSVWLLYYKKKSKISTIDYSGAVDEALCFGWVDSKTKKLDDVKYIQFFCRRKPNSVWSKVNKEKVARLMNEGLMTKSGLDVIERAKINGSWTILDDVEALIIPLDLEDAFKNSPDAKNFFLNLSRSDKRNILQWLVLAKRKETRENRIQEIVTLAEQGLKPKQFR